MEQTLHTTIDGFISIDRAGVVDIEGPRARFRTSNATVEVTALSSDLFRVGMFPNGHALEYPNHAVVKTDWPNHDLAWTADAGKVFLTTSRATIDISTDPLRVQFRDGAGRTFADDDHHLGMGIFPRHPVPNNEPIDEFLGPEVRLYKRRAPNEHYFGCGERTGGLEKTHSHQIFWNVDPSIGHTAAHNNMYTSIPFLLAVSSDHAWGLFFDNPGHVEFDLAHESSERLWFGAATGNLVYYVFTGPTPRDVLEQYTELTGRTPVPPLWALGNQQSRHSYPNAEEVRAVAHEFRERRIPCDTLYLDIYYMDGFRVFTWDRERFPDLPGLLEELRELGFHVITIIDPGVKVDEKFPVYVEGKDRNLFCKTRGGAEYHNIVWPGLCAFPDFTNPKTRQWWGEKHAPLVDAGVSGIWCDMNEPALFVPEQSTMPGDTVHHGDDQPTFHALVHNLYGLFMARATREGLEALRPDERPVVITRSAYAGVQRYALQWTGDNSSWWEHLAMSLPQLQNLGLSGVAWCGVDIGGFFGDTSGELLARWTESGIWQAFCRNHSDISSRRQEPWLYGAEYEDPIRHMLLLRQRLIPYFYTLFEESHRTGAPILRPLLFEFPEDEATYQRDDQMLVGPALLVAPITKPGTEHRHVYLPAGTWFHLWSGERTSGPAHILAHAPLGRPAVYVRANTPVPLWPEMQHVGESAPDPLTIAVYPHEGEGFGNYYEDAGNGYAFEHGMYSRRQITCAQSAEMVTVRFARREGEYIPSRRRVVLELRSVPPAELVLINSEQVEWNYSADTRTIRVEFQERADPAEIRARFMALGSS